MKRISILLSCINFLLLIVLFLSYDPFSFDPKTYEEGNLLFGFESDEIRALIIQVDKADEKKNVKISNQTGVWRIKRNWEETEKIPDPMQIQNFLSKLLNIREFPYKGDPSKLNLSEKFTSENIQIQLKSNLMYDLHSFGCRTDLELCFLQIGADKTLYSYPLREQLPISIFFEESILDKQPFGSIPEDRLIAVEYHSNQRLVYSIHYLNGNWKIFPEVDGTADEMAIQQFFKRVRFWTSDSVTLDKKFPTNARPTFVQYLRVLYRNDSGGESEIKLIDYGNIYKGKLLAEMYPYQQFYLFSAFSWEYWKFFDVKQLLK
ncbi:hypothetical protein LPTSP4_23450 [Leptospira ryugenii]|uniref:DUF4340 domain-containing protein n=1 Tax=Leptospira ryugenii TaxID=1917863 RepID=A0A2P2E1Q0_9LEPT|nr:hypothetical protein [Leptospira ryugenii]GBF50818.1 hypothetical protein LPTSP4_23450 [Leptospira ryugenii]